MKCSEKFASLVAQVADTVKLRYLGLGFVWAWVYCAWDTFLLFPASDGLSINSDPSWLISAVTIVVVLLGGSAWVGRLYAGRRAAACVLAVVLSALGTVACALAHSSVGAVAFVLSVAGAVATGVGTGLFYFLWADVLGSLDQEQVEVVVPVCAAVPALFVLAPGLGSLHVVGVGLVALLPVISGLMLLACLREDVCAQGEGAPAQGASALGAACEAGEACGAAAGSAVPVSRVIAQSDIGVMRDFVRPGVSLMLAFASLCFLAASVDSSLVQETGALFGGVDLSVFLSSLVGIGIALACISHSVHIDLTAAYRWLAPVTLFAIACSTLPGVTGVFLSFCAQDIANVALEIMVVVGALGVARTYGISASLYLGVIWGCCQVGILAGNVLGSMALGAQLNAGVSLATWAPWLALAFVVGMSVISQTPARRVQPAFSVVAEAHPAKSAPQAEPALDGGENTPASTVAVAAEGEGEREHSPARPTPEVFAAEHGLTARETEVFGLLVRGRSVPYIREQLFLSKSTVATHVKHIYKKLDVHSKQELIDLYEGEGQ